MLTERNGVAVSTQRDGSSCVLTLRVNIAKQKQLQESRSSRWVDTAMEEVNVVLPLNCSRWKCFQYCTCLTKPWIGYCYMSPSLFGEVRGYESCLAAGRQMHERSFLRGLPKHLELMWTAKPWPLDFANSHKGRYQSGGIRRIPSRKNRGFVFRK